ncbi:MAG: cupin domain-containing protein, partial [Pseudolabrys sp.]
IDHVKCHVSKESPHIARALQNDEMERTRGIGASRFGAAHADWRSQQARALYAIRLKFPAGFKVAPHTHPDSREVTVLSGTWYTGYGDKAEAADLKELPAGSFYTEPANVAHYVEIREPTLIQVSGTGPSGRKFVGPDAPK